MKATVETVTEKRTKDGKLFYAVVAGGEKYSCWSEKIADKVNQEVEFDVQTREWNGFEFKTMKLIDGASSGGYSKGGYKAAYNTSAPKTMVLSYAKDIVVALIVKGDLSDPMEATSLTTSIYHELYKEVA